MSGEENLGPQFLELYHGTSARDAASIRESGLRPSRNPIVNYAPTLTDSPEHARSYAGPIGEIVKFRIPQGYADRHLSFDKFQHLDSGRTDYAIRRKLPARYAVPPEEER